MRGSTRYLLRHPYVGDSRFMAFRPAPCPGNTKTSFEQRGIWVSPAAPCGTIKKALWLCMSVELFGSRCYIYIQIERSNCTSVQLTRGNYGSESFLSQVVSLTMFQSTNEPRWSWNGQRNGIQRQQSRPQPYSAKLQTSYDYEQLSNHHQVHNIESFHDHQSHPDCKKFIAEVRKDEDIPYLSFCRNEMLQYHSTATSLWCQWVTFPGHISSHMCRLLNHLSLC